MVVYHQYKLLIFIANNDLPLLSGRFQSDDDAVEEESGDGILLF